MSEEESMMDRRESVATEVGMPPSYNDTVQKPSTATAPVSSAGGPYPKQPGINPSPAPEFAFIARQAQMRYSKQNLKYTRYILAFPLWLSIVYCCVNAIIPGLGVMMSTFFVCLGHTVVRGDCKAKLAVLNFFLGLLCVMTFYFGIGWIIAYAWCAATVAASRFYYNDPIEEHEIRSDVPGVEHAADVTAENV